MIRAFIFICIWVLVGFQLETRDADPVWHQLAGAILAYIDVFLRRFSKVSDQILAGGKKG